MDFWTLPAQFLIYNIERKIKFNIEIEAIVFTKFVKEKLIL